MWVLIIAVALILAGIYLIKKGNSEGDGGFGHAYMGLFCVVAALLLVVGTILFKFWRG